MQLADEKPFRIAFGVFWLLNFTVRIHFQMKAIGAKKSFSKNERRARFFFRLLALTYLFMLVYIFSDWFDFAHLPLPGWVRWFLGYGILMAYLVLFGWTHRALGKNWSGLLEIHQDHVLVINGPYRFVRHPMYSAFFLSGIGFFLLSANWFIAGVYLLTVTAMIFDRISSEEAMMIECFGDSYLAYMRNTGRLLPRLKK